MRYSREHKQAMRQRIIEAAGRRFKTDGIDGSGIAALMADAGLTNGAFYAHFDSKDDLVATTVAPQLHAQCESVGVLPPGRAGVEHILREYLSVRHRDDPGHGCPSAALLDEIGRSADATKRVYTDGVLAVIGDFAVRRMICRSADVKVLSIYAVMIGAMPLSRRPTARRRDLRARHPERPHAGARRR